MTLYCGFRPRINIKPGVDKVVNRFKNSSGFTLLELMMVSALMGIFLIVIYSVLSHNFHFLNQYNNEKKYSHQARIALEKTVTLIRKYENWTEVETSEIKNIVQHFDAVKDILVEDNDDKTLKITVVPENPVYSALSTSLRKDRHYDP